MKKKLTKKIFFKKIVKQDKIQKINLYKGNIEKILNKNSKLFKGFGEIYFSHIKKNSIKCWKLHKKNYSLIFVIHGKVNFVFYYKNNFYKILLTKKLSNLISIPPNLWFGFQGVGQKNIICNIMDNLHSDKEVAIKKTGEIKYKWIKIKN